MRARRGMTLLEVLVGLAILSLTGLLLNQGLALGTRAWDRAGAVARPEFARVEAARTLRRLIEQAEPVAAAQPEIAFRGAPASVAFLYRGAPRLTAGQPRLLRLSRDAGDGTLSLAITDPGGAEPAESLPLLDGTAELALRYFGRDPETGLVGWSERWTDGVALPDLVELTVAFADGSAPLQVLAAPAKRLPLECIAFGMRACVVSAQ